MFNIKLLYSCILFISVILFVSCKNDNENIVDLHTLDDITMLSSKYIRTKVGTPVQFSLQVPTSDSITYTWIFNKEIFSTKRNPIKIFNAPGTGYVTVILKNSSGGEKVLATKLFIAKNKDMKLLSYYPSYQKYDDNKAIWDKLTHICLSFGVVNAEGTVDLTAVKNNSMLNIVNDAHFVGVNVLLCIGGGSGANADSTYGFTKAILNTSIRTSLINNLIRILQENDLDGIDVDYEHWQGGITNTNKQRSAALKAFYQELNIALHSKNYSLSASVSNNNIRNGYVDSSMIEYLDFVNFMLYDNVGNNVGSMASWSFFVNSISTAINKNIPKNKILAGIPFYGILFPNAPSTSGSSEVLYKDIVLKYPGAENKDAIEGKYIYYDGIPTVNQKTQYVIDNQLAGVMIWEITQDSDNSTKSLLNAIDGLLKISN